jgi:TatD DNase family protein
LALLTDTHCHLNLNPVFDDLEEVLKRAWDSGINRILIPGIDLETSCNAVALCNRYPNLYAAVGIHPNDALKWDKSSSNQLLQLAKDPKVVAIGEIGLDFYRDYCPIEIQENVFLSQLEIASDLNLPVIIHNRQAFAKTWNILYEWRQGLLMKNSSLAIYPGVMHSFDGSLEDARQAIEQNFFVGVTGPITFRNAKDRQQTIQSIPLNCLLLETDAPYLTPHPYRGQRNEPAFVRLIAETIASLHHVPLEIVAIATSENANRLFSWRAFV